MERCDVDPYKMLGVQKNFTPDQLRAAYKKMALAMHPDKQGGNDYMFKMMTTCYKQLVKEYNKRITDRQFHELKAESQRTTQNYAPIIFEKSKNFSKIEPAAPVDSKSFNVERFNQVFEKNRLSDKAVDSGYNDWLKTGDDGQAAPKFKGKFTSMAFNEQFEKSNKNEASKHLIKYTEPEPMFAGKKIQYTELGVENIDDYSADNLSRKNLNYMDLKLAHTTSRIVDPSTVGNRKEYKSIGDVEADRAHISYNMNESEMREYMARKKADELREKKRVQNLNTYDKRTLEHYEQVNRMMLGGR